jgi:type IV pilus assembly protein PilV
MKIAKSSMRTSPRAVRGAALIEAMIGILLFSIGILGLVGLQASMTSAQSAAKYRADAAYLASELLGTMWMNKVNLGVYATTPASPCTDQRCLDWVNKVASGLPQGTATVAVTPSTGDVNLTVGWTAPNEGTRAYVLATTIK